MHRAAPQTCCRLRVQHCSNRRRAVGSVHACRLPFFEPDHRLMVVKANASAMRHHTNGDCNRRPRRQPDPYCRQRSPNGAGTGSCSVATIHLRGVDLDMDADNAATKQQQDAVQLRAHPSWRRSNAPVSSGWHQYCYISLITTTVY